MPKNRSPRYPAVGLPGCIRGVRVIHQKDTLTKIDQEAVAKHLGYGGLSGPALGHISAIRKYGLMEGPGKALQVTKDALTIIADSVESPERQAAIQRSARRPALFAKLFDHFEDQKPSVENLRSYLTKQGFTASGMRKAAKAFLDTIDLVSQEGGVYHPNGEGEEEGAELPPIPEVITQGGLSPLPRFKRDEGKPGMKQDVFTLREGDVVLQWPESISPESYEDLESWTKLVLRKIQRHIIIHTKLPEDEGE